MALEPHPSGQALDGRLAVRGPTDPCATEPSWALEERRAVGGVGLEPQPAKGG
jgi:hypothetical protein